MDFRQQIANMGLQKPDGYNPYAAGEKVYGYGSRHNPTSGPVSASGQQGYAQRDNQVQAKKNALLSRMKMAEAGNYMSSGYLRGE